MANEIVAFPNDERIKFGGINAGGFCAVGNNGDAIDGAFRFGNIQILQGQNISMAKLVLPYSSVGDPSGDWVFKVEGIDEDDTSSFSSSVFGRSRTSQQFDEDEGAPTSGGTKTIDVKDIVEEIVDRGGWSSGNDMGFVFEDQGSDEDIYAYFDINDSYLTYRVSGEPDFTPTPKTVSTATFPATYGYGLKIAPVGFDATTAADSDLLFTSDKEYMKVKAEGLVSCTAGVDKLVAHGLGYAPYALCYVRGNSKSFQAPRLMAGATDPVGGGVEIYTKVDATYLRITVLNTDADVYYYIFYDGVPI